MAESLKDFRVHQMNMQKLKVFLVLPEAVQLGDSIIPINIWRCSAGEGDINLKSRFKKYISIELNERNSFTNEGIYVSENFTSAD